VAILTAEIADVINRTADSFGVPRGLALALAKIESGYDPRAVSPAGAQGLFQLMPATQDARGVRDPFDPVQSARGGLGFLASLSQRFGDWRAALAAYNWGPKRLEDAIAEGRAIHPDVRAYVDKVITAWGPPGPLPPTAPPRTTAPDPTPAATMPPPPGVPTGDGWAWVWGYSPPRS
jgi:soluble lytic murein transglycosylase-like protein